MIFLFLLLICLLSVQVTVQVMDKCDPSHNCLTCAGLPYNCATCPSGYFLARGGAYYTCKSCPSQCLECDHYTYCTACHITSHYGRICQSVCSKGCLNSTCEQFSGTCLCKNNFEGGHCDYCKSGKYGFDSDCKADCPTNCKRCVSSTNCTECKDGYYGYTCDLSCSRGCYMGKCIQSDGTCYQNKCNLNFDGINCSQCTPRRFGNNCTSICQDNCVSCSSATTCDECKDGFWGNLCQNNCSHGCSDDVCLKKAGVCQDNKCRPGFIGEKCDRCTAGKHGLNCDKNETIFQKDSSASAIHFHMFSMAAVVLSCLIDVSGTVF